MRVVAAFGEVSQEGRRLLVRHRLHYVLVATVAVVVSCAGLVYAVEEQAANATIKTFGTGLWWAIATVTTVGYGDVVPRTPVGRGIAAFLMLGGIALFGVLTANLASFFLQSDEEARDLRLDAILGRLERIEAKLEQQR